MLQKIAAVVLVLIALALVLRKFYHQFKGDGGSACPFCDQQTCTSEKEQTSSQEENTDKDQHETRS